MFTRSTFPRIRSAAAALTVGLLLASAHAVPLAQAQSAAGCIEVRTETFNPQGSPVTPVAQFTFQMDGAQSATNNALGIARFENVSVGTHAVSLQLPSPWVMESVSPAGGVVAVNAGSSCAQVTFRAKQVIATASATMAVTDGRDLATVGDIVTYTITVTNTSQTQITGATVTDTLPVYLQFLSASDGPQVSGNTVTWNNVTVGIGGVRTFTVQARVLNATVGTVIVNPVQISGSVTATAQDTTLVDDGDDDVGECPDVTIESDEDEVEPGGEITYTITLENNTGDDDEFDVTLALPDGVIFQDANEDGEEEDDETVEWTEIEVDDGDEIELTATVEVDEDEVDDGDELEATVISGCGTDDVTVDVDDDGNDDDDNDDDDDDNDDEELSVTKDASPSEVFPGGTVEYTVTVENNGDVTLKDIEVEDHLSGSSFSIIDDGDADSVSGNTLKWKIKELKKGKTKIFRYRILVDNAAYPGATVSNNVKVENDDTDDSANATVTVIGSLPQTGFGGKAGVSTAHLTPFTDEGSSGTVPAAAAASAALTGLAAAAGILRRKFLGA